MTFFHNLIEYTEHNWQNGIGLSSTLAVILALNFSLLSEVNIKTCITYLKQVIKF
jgi:hypothetical protein